MTDQTPAPLPATGGSYDRDPVTGELTPVPLPTAPVEAPVNAPLEHAVEPAKARKEPRA